MKKCLFCFRKIEDNSIECFQCGTPLELDFLKSKSFSIHEVLDTIKNTKDWKNIDLFHTKQKNVVDLYFEENAAEMPILLDDENMNQDDEDYLTLTENDVKKQLENDFPPLLDSRLDSKNIKHAESGILPLPEQNEIQKQNESLKNEEISRNHSYKIVGICSDSEDYPWIMFPKKKTSFACRFFYTIFILFLGFIFGILCILFFPKAIFSICSYIMF